MTSVCCWHRLQWTSNHTNRKGHALRIRANSIPLVPTSHHDIPIRISYSQFPHSFLHISMIKKHIRVHSVELGITTSALLDREFCCFVSPSRHILSMASERHDTPEHRLNKHKQPRRFCSQYSKGQEMRNLWAIWTQLQDLLNLLLHRH
jgi:hypothetical protein